MSNSDILSSLSNQMADAVERAAKSLVTVNGRDRQSATGIVYANELVLTAEHVVERDDNLTVIAPDGKKLNAQLLGRDPSTDLAVLRVTGLVADGAATGGVARVGQLILAVGRPGGDEAGGVMASSGVVSAVGGPIRGNGVNLEQYIRTDATPYPGFSGGPVIDANGAVLGVLTTGLARGVTLAIPMSIALRVAETLTQQGSIKRGYLGVISQQVKLPPNQRGGQSQEHGLLVMRVEDNSPAEQGGVLMGDILVSIDGHAVTNADDLLALLNSERVGKAVNLGVIRGGNLQKVSVVVGQRK
jgi:S1-C subfamily serine protease